MPEDKWTIAQDLANELCPDDEAAGLEQIAAMLSGIENWIDANRRRIALMSIATGGSTLASLGAIIASSFGIYPSAWVSPTFCAISFAAFGVSVGLPNIVQTALIRWAGRRPFDDERLEPLRVYIAGCVEKRRALFDQDNEKISREFMQSPWALLLFSDRQAIRKIPIDRTKGLMHRRHQNGVFIRKQAALFVTTTVPAERPIISVFVDQRTTTNVDQRTANVVVVGRTANPAPSPPASKMAKAQKPTHENHWLHGIAHSDFLRLSAQVVNRYRDTPAQQVRTMLDVAYATFNENPDWDVTKVRQVVCEALTKKQLPIGLHKKPDAVEWIDKMLARSGNGHRYHYVRRLMTEPGYVPRNGKRSQPDLFAARV